MNFPRNRIVLTVSGNHSRAPESGTDKLAEWSHSPERGVIVTIFIRAAWGRGSEWNSCS